ncbi:hypothetical protein VTO42DRAFT_5758 [Malbranchea cinnamomea]
MNGNWETSGPARGAGKIRRLKRRLRHATVFDAVAGRVSTRGFIAQPSLVPENEEPELFSSLALRPEEVLFRRLRAPTRYMENDFYFAHESLPPDRALPDSDLLKAIHTYSSDFYTYATPDRGQTSWRSMDETALIALGFLLEETAKEALEETGDMVFVEGEEVLEEAEDSDAARTSVSGQWGRKRAGTASSVGLEGRENELSRFREQNRKRRRRMKERTDSGSLDAAGG